PPRRHRIGEQLSVPQTPAPDKRTSNLTTLLRKNRAKEAEQVNLDTVFCYAIRIAEKGFDFQRHEETQNAGLTGSQVQIVRESLQIGHRPPPETNRFGSERKEFLK